MRSEKIEKAGRQKEKVRKGRESVFLGELVSELTELDSFTNRSVNLYCIGSLSEKRKDNRFEPFL